MVQGNDNRPGTRQILEFGRPHHRARAHGNGTLGHMVDPRVVTDDGQVVGQQHRIQHIQNLTAQQRLARMQAHHRFATSVDGVVELEQVS